MYLTTICTYCGCYILILRKVNFSSRRSLQKYYFPQKIWGKIVFITPRPKVQVPSRAAGGTFRLPSRAWWKIVYKTREVKKNASKYMFVTLGSASGINSRVLSDILTLPPLLCNVLILTSGGNEECRKSQAIYLWFGTFFIFPLMVSNILFTRVCKSGHGYFPYLLTIYVNHLSCILYTYIFFKTSLK